MNGPVKICFNRLGLKLRSSMIWRIATSADLSLLITGDSSFWRASAEFTSVLSSHFHFVAIEMINIDDQSMICTNILN